MQELLSGNTNQLSLELIEKYQKKRIGENSSSENDSENDEVDLDKEALSQVNVEFMDVNESEDIRASPSSMLT